VRTAEIRLFIFPCLLFQFLSLHLCSSSEPGERGQGRKRGQSRQGRQRRKRRKRGSIFPLVWVGSDAGGNPAGIELHGRRGGRGIRNRRRRRSVHPLSRANPLPEGKHALAGCGLHIFRQALAHATRAVIAAYVQVSVKTELPDTFDKGTKRLCLLGTRCGRRSHKSGVRSPELSSL
jgi:hypothetical protein